MNYEKARKTAESIVSQMTAEEKISQLVYTSPAIERLGIHEYSWWNEAAHGVARAGIATVFPQAIAMAATFNPELTQRVGDAVSTEARAKYNKSIKFEDYDSYKGLTFWTPNINIFRDGRWGRGQETFGECPYLTSKLGTAYMKGLQGEGEFLKSAACAKHFAVHSGPEKKRHGFDAKVSLKDLWETYLPAFEHLVKNEVAGVMGAYNRTNGEPCCAHSYLMEKVLLKEWEFKGYFVSDCGAINDIYEGHHYTQSLKEAAAVALKRGCDLNCGFVENPLFEAWEEDLVDEADLNRAVINLYTIRALLGEFEEKMPFRDIPYSALDCDEHKNLNLEAAEECFVLLKNENNFLPVKNGEYKKIAVIGPNANSVSVLEGNYNGVASEYVTFADGIRKKYFDSRIMVASGSHLFIEKKSSWAGFENLWSEGVATAEEADLTILCLGLDRSVEGEEILNLDDESLDGGDKKNMSLPRTQIKLAEMVCDTCENVVVLVTCGSPVDLGKKITSKAKAVLHGWYPGALGGLAFAKLLSGEVSPSGKLPITFYKNETVLPEIEDYNMQGKTYRYFDGEPLYPFGFGLSYANFTFDDFKIKEETEDGVCVEVRVTNKGAVKAKEKVQVYAKFTHLASSTPNFQLCGIAPVLCEAGESKTVEIKVDKYWLKAVNENGERVTPDGQITLYVGGHQPDSRSNSLCGNECLEIKL